MPCSSASAGGWVEEVGRRSLAERAINDRATNDRAIVTLKANDRALIASAPGDGMEGTEGTDVTGNGLRRVSGLVGMLLLVQAVVLGIVLGMAPARLVLPITLGLPDAPERIQLFAVDIGAAVIVLTLLVAVSRLVVVLPAVFPLYFSGICSNRHTARWIEFVFSSSITLFLVAQLNGISDIGSLVLGYTITSGMTLFSVLQERSVPLVSGRMLPLWFGAAIGIVPWGVIAFHQVSALVVGQPPFAFVRVITLTMLASAFAFFVCHWHDQRRRDQRRHDQPRKDSVLSAVAGERTHILLSLASTSVFAWLVAFGVLGVGHVRF